MKNLSKQILLFLAIILFTSCGELTTSNSPNNQTDNSQTPDNTQEPEMINPSENTTDNSQGTRPTLINNSNSVVLQNIVETIQNLSTSGSNSTQYGAIMNWVENIANETNELTAKDFRTIVSSYTNRELSYIGENIFSTDSSLTINNSGDITAIGLNRDTGGGVVFINKDSDIAFVQDSIVISTGDLNISHSTNSIIIANGNLNISNDGVNQDSNTDDGSIIYNKQDVNVSHSYGSVFLFEHHVETSFIYDGDCINTGTTNSSHGQCNEISTTRLTEN